MSIAWATILFILIMLPGVAVLMGMAAPERFSREIVKSTALGEIALAVFVAILIHSLSIALLSVFFNNPLDVLRPIVVFETQNKVVLVWPLVKAALPKLALYLLLTSVFGFLLGLLAAKLIQSGPLGSFAAHRWVYDVVRYSKGKNGIVTAYVMTKTVENNRALMYKGRLAEIYLKDDGNISYLSLKNCLRFYMNFEDLSTTGQQLDLLASSKKGYQFDEWNYLIIGGEEIANVLFNRSPDIIENEEGLRALDDALADVNRRIDAILGPAQKGIVQRASS